VRSALDNLALDEVVVWYAKPRHRLCGADTIVRILGAADLRARPGSGGQTSSLRGGDQGSIALATAAIS